MIRFYPSPEGTEDSSGKSYPFLPMGEVRPELTTMLDAIRQLCHMKGYNLIVESLNHGRHGPGSMHYRGLACDLNVQDSNKHWLTFDEQSDLVVEASNSTGLDVWIFKADPEESPSHTHFSVKPISEEV